MRLSDAWKEYELIDCSDGERLERWGEVILVRPDPQVIWKTEKSHPQWKAAHAKYIRSSSGGGRWETYKRTDEFWKLAYKDLQFKIATTGFKHTGLFPEQAVNWDYLAKKIKSAGRPVKVLNLFAYTGAASIACLKAGAHVTHVDAAKGMVAWAKENAVLNQVEDKNVRWLVDDCQKFVAREIRRAKRYDIIIMDPPSYGRGPGGEVWKLEDEIYSLVDLCKGLLDEKSFLFLINSYTSGLSASVMKYILASALEKEFGGKTDADEIGLPVTFSGLALPCGATSIWSKTDE